MLGVPAVVVAVVVAVANRQSVIFSLDPFSQISPAFAPAFGTSTRNQS